MSEDQSRDARGATVTEYDVLPSVGWVVHEVIHERAGDPDTWAWCKVEIDRHGYAEIAFTKTDGSTPADDPTSKFVGPLKPTLRLGAVLFKLWC